jgi:hypothetical protein
MPVYQRRLSVWLRNFLFSHHRTTEGAGCLLGNQKVRDRFLTAIQEAKTSHPYLRLDTNLLNVSNLSQKTLNFRPCGFRPHFTLLMSAFSRNPQEEFLDCYWCFRTNFGARSLLAIQHPMAKVGYLDPWISDNHTYLPWVVTHSLQDSSYQAHIRKFLTS